MLLRTSEDKFVSQKHLCGPRFLGGGAILMITKEYLFYEASSGLAVEYGKQDLSGSLVRSIVDF